MATLKDFAEKYEPKKTKNIAELPSFDINEPMEEKKGKDMEGTTFTYTVLIRDEEEYRCPNSVLEKLQELMEQMPNQKEFKVTKKGEGMGTKYSVIPIVEVPESKTEDAEPAPAEVPAA